MNEKEKPEELDEWTRYRIQIPEDDFDEDDEMDDRIAEAERRRKGRVDRGGFRGV